MKIIVLKQDTNHSSENGPQFNEVLGYLPEHSLQIYYSLPKFSAEAPLDYNKDAIKKKSIKSVPEGGMYEGEWNKETKERDGFGVVVWNDGSMYQGYWKRDQPEGPGRMVCSLSNSWVYRINEHQLTIESNNVKYRFMLMAGFTQELSLKEISMDLEHTLESILSNQDLTKTHQQ